MSLGNQTPSEYKSTIKSQSGSLGERPELRGSGTIGPNPE